MTTNKYNIIYDKDTIKHLKFIDKKHWKLIKETIENQLNYQPDVETKNKKPLSKPPVDNRWELRFGPKNCFRVFYKIIKDDYEIWVLAIGIKIRNTLIIGGEEIEL